MKKIILFLFVLSGVNCADDFDDNPVRESINDFIWDGLNTYYFWQADSPDLNDSKNDNTKAYTSFLDSYPNPVDFFNHLKVNSSIDRFSVIFSDYTVLEQALSGVSQSNGLDIELRLKNGSSTEVFGWVRYVMPNSDASTKNVQRGAIFYAINGIPLNTNNYSSLLANTTYTLDFADFDNGNITPNGNSISFTKTPYAENPIFLSNVFNVGTKKVGYIVYNGFYSAYENDLNAVFSSFQSQNITHLVLDLRYNSGGSINTATRLASMITGQFGNQVFSKQQWNSKITNANGGPNSEVFLNRFTNQLANGANISSLGLTKVYIITTKSTASASELIINSLKPYIDVIQIGRTTIGKNEGSITIYDSPTFQKNNISPNHKFAMQPIVLKLANAANFGDYATGLVPNINQAEDLSNLGQLGNVSEPLLETTLNYISTNGRYSNGKFQDNPNFISSTKLLSEFGSLMNLENGNTDLKGLK